MKKINDQCAFLDDDGKRCKEPAVKSGNYIGDSEIYYDYCPDKRQVAQWVRVRFCAEHYRANNPFSK